MADYTPEQTQEFRREYQETLNKAEELAKKFKTVFSDETLRRSRLWRFYAEDVGNYQKAVPEGVRKQLGLEKKLNELFNIT